MKKALSIIVMIITSLSVMAQQKENYDIIVAQDGTGDFKTVQEAFNAVPDYRKAGETRIFIRNGIYKEKLILAESKQNVTIIGESVEGTILTYDDYASKPNKFGENTGTSGSSSCYIYGPDFHAFNITFSNTAGPVGQAVALFVSGDRAVFVNCRFKGFQDTLYTYGKRSKQLYKDCYIEGTVDFIFGASTCFFDNCQIHSLRRGYLTAASTLQDVKYGYVLHKCRLTAEPGVEKVMLGRPWRPYAKTVYIDCVMGSHISPEGWHNWGVEKEKTAFYGESGSVNTDGKQTDTGKRVKWVHTIDKDDYTINKVLADKDNPEWYIIKQQY